MNDFNTLFVENIFKSLEEVDNHDLVYFKDIFNGVEKTLINMGNLFGVVVDELYMSKNIRM